MTEQKKFNDHYAERGEALFTKRFANVNDTTGVEIQLPIYAKEIKIHYEGATVVAVRTGKAVGSGPVNVTSDGYTEVFPVLTLSTESVMNIKAPTGQVLNISVTAW